MDESFYEPWKDVRSSYIFTLIDIVQANNWRNISYIESIYKERAIHFNKTLFFLEHINLLSIDGDKINIIPHHKESLTQKNSIQVACYLLERIIALKNNYRIGLIKYINQFNFLNDSITHHPLGEISLTQTPVRNFLIELGVVEHLYQNNYYRIKDEFLDIWLLARTSVGFESKTEIIDKLQQQQQIGYDAELSVIEYEKIRLGEKFVDTIIHVSATIPSACFDIKSITITPNGITHPRYIEVKAVSEKSLEFHWSAAEIEVAQIFREKYFLYLLPVTENCVFDFDRILIISDPFINVYKCTDQWITKPSSYICRPVDQEILK